jgi:NADH-quinone oxidoreductase subunit L
MILVFWGEAKTEIGHRPGKLMTVPLIVLAFFSLFAGFIELPHNFGHFTLFSDLLHQVLPETVLKAGMNNELQFQVWHCCQLLVEFTWLTYSTINNRNVLKN